MSSYRVQTWRRDKTKRSGQERLRAWGRLEAEKVEDDRQEAKILCHKSKW